MQENDKNIKLYCPNCGKSGNMIKKNGFTKKGTQRYKCNCGKTFVPITYSEIPNCRKCNNNLNVIKWGEKKNKYGYIRNKCSRYYCKEHKMTFSNNTENFDKVAIISAYELGGDVALREFVFDKSGNQIPYAFVAIMEILQEYRSLSKFEQEILLLGNKKKERY